jgi:hypothetical protein
MLALPNEYRRFELVDTVAGSVERLDAVGGGDGDDDGGLPDREGPDAVLHPHSEHHGPLLGDALTERRELGGGLLLVRLVVEARDGSSLRLVADGAGEDHGCTSGGVGDEPVCVLDGQRLVRQAGVKPRWHGTPLNIES